MPTIASRSITPIHLLGYKFDRKFVSGYSRYSKSRWTPKQKANACVERASANYPGSLYPTRSLRAPFRS